MLNNDDAEECPLWLPNSLEHDIGIILLSRTQGLG